MNNFKVGDTVILTKNRNLSYGWAALKGAIAKITAIKEEFIIVDWIDELASGQQNGGYYPEDFDLIKSKTIRDVEIGDFIRQPDWSKGLRQKVLCVIGDLIALGYSSKLAENDFILSGWVTKEYLEINGYIYFEENSSNTITIEGKTYNKEEVEKRLAELKPVE